MLKELGHSTSVLEDMCVFTTNQHLIVFFFVDEVVLTFHEEFRKAFGRKQMQGMGKLKGFLDTRVMRDRHHRRKLWLPGLPY
jgi:hypothetical protein